MGEVVVLYKGEVVVVQAAIMEEYMRVQWTIDTEMVYWAVGSDQGVVGSE